MLLRLLWLAVHLGVQVMTCSHSVKHFNVTNVCLPGPVQASSVHVMLVY